MHTHLTFQNPSALPHDVVAATLEQALGDRTQEPEAADALAARAEADPSDVDGRALDGLDDVRSFLRL